MTYQLPLKRECTAQQLRTVTKQNERLYHTLRFDLVHLADPQTALITVGDLRQKVQLRIDLNQVDVLLPIIDQIQRLEAKVSIGDQTQVLPVELGPVKEWTIHLVQHSHTDIGYTRPQSEILTEHLRFIDLALDYCDQTDPLPPAAQFRWTCEASWTVKEYLESRPEVQVNRLLQRIKEGRIEVTGMYFNFCDIVDETALAIQAQTLKTFKDRGIDVTTAMQNDVNGIGWCMIDVFHGTGVKYLTMGQHGHRARIPFDQPTSFWWESPSGKRLLAFRSEHYMHGNTLSLTTGKLDVFRDNLSNYLGDLDEKGYPFDRLALQFSGYITDNSPPSTKACDIVRAWNEKYEWPKLKLSLASEFMHYLEANHSDQLEVQKVAWPDWWTDGFGSAMNETKVARSTHANLIATSGLLAMARMAGSQLPPGISAALAECYESLLFYDEHTFGADESISNPSSTNSINQWRQKSSYVWSAKQDAELLREKAIGLILPQLPDTPLPSITVFNTLNWKRSGRVEVFIDHDILPLDKAYAILDAQGQQVPAQIVQSRNDGTKWALWVNDIPPLGYQVLRIQVLEAPLLSTSSPAIDTSPTIENQYYRLTVDRKRAGILSLFDKDLQKEWLDPSSEYQLGEFVLEQLHSRSDLERLTYLNRDTTYRPLDKTMIRLSDCQVVGTRSYPLWHSLYLRGQIPECADAKGLAIEIRLYHHTKMIELVYRMNKLPNTDPEGGYVAFPFRGEGADQLRFDVQGGVVEPGVDQLEGTAADWNTIQHFASLRSGATQMVFSSNDIPLVQLGAINTGHFYYRHRPQKPHLYSWVFNNYWTTNFKASQQGALEWRYWLTSSSDHSVAFATKFGWGNRVPLIARVRAASSGGGEEEKLVARLLDLSTTGDLLLVNARPALDGKSLFLHLRETEGQPATLDVEPWSRHPRVEAVVEVNSLEEKIRVLSAPWLIQALETKFLRLELKD